MAVNLVYDINDKPPFAKLIVLAVQQLLAIMAATIAVPVAIGLPTQVPSAILGAGVGTLVYLLFTRFKSPVFLGSSFAFISSLIAATSFGYLGILVGAAFAGMVYVIIAVVIHFAGTKWVSKLMPPVVIGPTVALIGLSLAGSAVTSITTAAGDTFNAALARKLADGCSAGEAIVFANYASALAVSKPGAQDSVPSYEEVLTFKGSVE